jgi:hypothetical protein
MNARVENTTTKTRAGKRCQIKSAPPLFSGLPCRQSMLCGYVPRVWCRAHKRKSLTVLHGYPSPRNLLRTYGIFVIRRAGVIKYGGRTVDQVVHFIRIRHLCRTFWNCASMKRARMVADEWEAVHAFFTEPRALLIPLMTAKG